MRIVDMGRRLVYRQAKPEDAAFAFLAFCAECAAMGLDNAFANSQSQAKTFFALTVGGLENLSKTCGRSAF
jgi:hypothetical protein